MDQWHLVTYEKSDSVQTGKVHLRYLGKLITPSIEQDKKEWINECLHILSSIYLIFKFAFVQKLLMKDTQNLEPLESLDSFWDSLMEWHINRESLKKDGKIFYLNSDILRANNWRFFFNNKDEPSVDPPEVYKSNLNRVLSNYTEIHKSDWDLSVAIDYLILVLEETIIVLQEKYLSKGIILEINEQEQREICTNFENDPDLKCYSVTMRKHGSDPYFLLMMTARCSYSVNEHYHQTCAQAKFAYDENKKKGIELKMHCIEIKSESFLGRAAYSGPLKSRYKFQREDEFDTAGMGHSASPYNEAHQIIYSLIDSAIETIDKTEF